MSPIEFKQQNIVFTAPAGMEDKGERPPASGGEGKVISGWHWSFGERLNRLFTGRLGFSVIGNAQPPIWLGVDCPFI